MLVRKYRIQSHYLTQQCFRGGNGLFSNPIKVNHLPVALLHGRLDWVCRPQRAWELHRLMPSSRLQWVDGCGHNPFEEANAHAIVGAIDYFAQHHNFSRWGTSVHQPSDL
jgi:proline iminopeptidase